jgi:hypothetical protein
LLCNNNDLLDFYFLKADELVQLISKIRKNEDLKNLFISICNLRDDQRKTIESLVSELSKVNTLH